jgi:hypothetical protein
MFLYFIIYIRSLYFFKILGQLGDVTGHGVSFDSNGNHEISFICSAYENYLTIKLKCWYYIGVYRFF